MYTNLVIIGTINARNTELIITRKFQKRKRGRYLLFQGTQNHQRYIPPIDRYILSRFLYLFYLFYILLYIFYILLYISLYIYHKMQVAPTFLYGVSLYGYMKQDFFSVLPSQPVAFLYSIKRNELAKASSYQSIRAASFRFQLKINRNFFTNFNS